MGLNLMCRKVKILCSLMLLIATLTPSISLITSAEDFRHSAYSYEFSLDVQVNYLVVLSNDTVAVLGSANGTSVIQLINVSETFSPKTLFTYPLSGEVTSYAVDGFPAMYIAVGTDLGEVVVLSIDRGRLYEKLHYIQGADFFINSVHLLRAPTTVKLVALSTNKKLPSEKYLYVFDINCKGVLRIGPTVGNMSYALEGITPYALAPVKVVDDGSYYYDPSKVFLTYSGLTASLNISAVYIYNNTEYPAGRSYLEVRLYNVRTNSIVFSYSANLGNEGWGVVLVPLGYIAEVVLYDIYGHAYRRTLNLSDVTRPEMIQLNFTLAYRPNTKEATEVMPANIKVLDFSKAPVEYEIITDLKFSNYTGTPLYIFSPSKMRGPAYLLMTEHLNYFNITYLYKNLTFADLMFYDYLGSDGAKVKYVDVDARGKYIVTALRDSRVKIYVYDELSKTYRLEQEYIAVGEPLNTKLAHVDGRPYYVIYTTEGLQILSLEPLQLPLLRFNTSLTYKVGGMRFADSSLDLSLIAIGGGNRLVIVKNLDKYLMTYGSRPLDVDAVRLPALTLNILTPNYTGVANAKVVFTYDNVSKEFTSDEFGMLKLSNIFPGKYLVSIYPQTPQLSPTNLTVEVPKAREVSYTVVLNYTTYPVHIILSDEYGGGPQVPLEIYLNGKLLASGLSAEEYIMELPYGSHDLTVRPARAYTYFYEETSLPVLVDGHRVLYLVLERKAYGVTLNIVDEVTKELTTDEVILSIDELGFIRVVNGSLTATLKAGRHEVRIMIPPHLSDKYCPTETYINIMTNSTFNIEVPRRTYTVVFKLLDRVTGEDVQGLYDIYVNDVRLVSGVENTFNLTLPYGTHSIRTRPQPPYDAIYTETGMSLVVDRDLTSIASVDRMTYSLLIRILDIISKVPITPVKVIINDTVVNLPTGTHSYTISLQYGTYSIKVLPDVGYEDVYEEYATTVNLTTNSIVDAVLNRKKYNLALNLYDVSAGPLLGLFDVLANDTMVVGGVRDAVNITLPYGIYVVKVKPQLQYMVLYKDYEATVKLFADTVMNVPLSRKYYTLTLMVRDDMNNPVFGAVVTLIDTVTGSMVARGVTDNNGRYSASTYYGSFQLIVSYGGFNDYVKSLDLTTDIAERVVLQPQPMTIIMRNMPLIVIATLIVVSMVVVVKLRGKIAERIYRSEHFEF